MPHQCTDLKQIFKIIAISSGGLILAGLIAFIPYLSLPHYSDFSVMYFTVKSLLHGISIYDYPAQLIYIKTLVPNNFEFLPYPYPPWYAFSTLFLGLLPIQAAANFWFLMNLAMISLASWLVTPGWSIPRRIIGNLAAVLYLPSLGLLIVGQYAAPVLLGAALFVFGARNKNSFWLAAGLILMTFKPHIGGFLFVGASLWLLWEKSSSSRKAFRWTVIGLVLLVLFGFFADPSWPVSYLKSLNGYRTLPGVQSCGLCASLSVSVIKTLTGKGDTQQAVLIGMGLLIAIVWLLLSKFQNALKDPFVLICLLATVTLLVDPYLLNYDYVLMILPIIWLATRSRMVVILYFLPIILLFTGRASNFVLPLGATVIFILILINSLTISPVSHKITSTIE